MLRRIMLMALAAGLVLGLAACEGQVEDSVTTEGQVATHSAAADTASRLITLEDVEAATGLTDLKTVAYDPKATVFYGDFNIADSAGNAVAIITVGDSETWDEWLTDGYSVSEPVLPPVGDESFVGPNPDASPALTLFAFRKGSRAVMIETGVDANGETVLDTEQLRALSDIIVARL